MPLAMKLALFISLVVRVFRGYALMSMHLILTHGPGSVRHCLVSGTHEPAMSVVCLDHEFTSLVAMAPHIRF